MNREHQNREIELIRKYQEKAREIERLREKIEEYKKKYNDLQNSKIIPEEKKSNTPEKEIMDNKIKTIFEIKEEDLNKEIQILNYNNKDNSNKEEIEKNCEIFIENNKIDFTYKYKFNFSNF